MLTIGDEGYIDEEMITPIVNTGRDSMVMAARSVREREELAYRILTSLPRASLAVLQTRIAPLLKLDIVGLLPTEIALQVFSSLPYQSLLRCALVCRRWRILADDPSLWKSLCLERKWEWRAPPNVFQLEAGSCPSEHTYGADSDSDDEGMGDEEDDEDIMHLEDSGFASMSMDVDYDSMHPSFSSPSASASSSKHLSIPTHLLTTTIPSSSSQAIRSPRTRFSAPTVMQTPRGAARYTLKPNYKLLHQTHVRLRNRFNAGSYTVSNLQTRGAPNSHSNTIYCLQLYTYPETGKQVLFTGSKDRTIREWDLAMGSLIRVLDGVHESSVLSICVDRGILASASSDRRVVVWDLARDQLIKVIRTHEDSVLCVRFDDNRLVSCSKDRTVRTYLFPGLTPHHVLKAHRAAVNAVSMSKNLIISASGDRSLRLWNAETGELLRTFENHHWRGIASIDFKHPFVLSGSSDKHIRLLDVAISQGWSTSPSADNKPPAGAGLGRTVVCEACGSTASAAEAAQPQPRRRGHEDLVRSVALGPDLVVSGSYDFTVKIWNRKTGALIADLAGGHTGRIFCVSFDCTKIVSCGEDQRICIWDFSHGIDTSFVKL